jgi:hypothetical protein
MSPFLRWGLFAIVAIGALVLAYNASKDIAATRARRPAAATPGALSGPQPVTAACELELAVAERALEARANGDSLDRLLRVREITLEEDARRRERLAAVARRWFAYERKLDPTDFRNVVMAECTAFNTP